MLWEKEENAGNQLFLLFPQHFLKSSETLLHTMSRFTCSEKTAFSEPCGKKRKCWLPAFSRFPTWF